MAMTVEDSCYLAKLVTYTHSCDLYYGLLLDVSNCQKTLFELIKQHQDSRGIDPIECHSQCVAQILGQSAKFECDHVEVLIAEKNHKWVTHTIFVGLNVFKMVKELSDEIKHIDRESSDSKIVLFRDAIKTDLLIEDINKVKRLLGPCRQGGLEYVMFSKYESLLNSLPPIKPVKAYPSTDSQ
jgi:hypothetical protein